MYPEGDETVKPCFQYYPEKKFGIEIFQNLKTHWRQNEAKRSAIGIQKKISFSRLLDRNVYLLTNDQTMMLAKTRRGYKI